MTCADGPMAKDNVPAAYAGSLMTIDVVLAVVTIGPIIEPSAPTTPVTNPLIFIVCLKFFTYHTKHLKIF